ncbi:MAG: potassium-transporting ATPase subunit KdpC [Bacteroidales bacterium]|jgi:K+-transporting ATPase ATPase C chain
MKTHIIPALKLTLVLLLFLSFGYTLIVCGISYLSTGKGEGKKIIQNGKVLGYEYIGQHFTNDKYFCGRPSANNYDASVSGGSNKSTTNTDYIKTVKARIDTFLIHNPEIKKSDIPAELVTASGSGLDPDISPEAAFIQIPRIAKVRKISIIKLQELVKKNTEHPLFGIFGPEKINVLKLNIALDIIK